MSDPKFIPKNKLKEVRECKKIQQTILAESIFIDQAQYSRKERGEVKISIEEWSRLAKALDVQLEEIYEDEPKSIKIVNNTDNEDNSINGFEITIKAPKTIFEEINTKLDKIIKHFDLQLFILHLYMLNIIF